MKTMQGWTDSKLRFNEYFTKDCEVNDEVYWYFMEYVPPIFIPAGFQVGEISHHRDGVAYYATFIRDCDRYFYIGYHPRRCSETQLVTL